MSMNHEGDERTAQRLRQRFFAWSVAIVSSLGTSGLVTLSPSQVWSQEESATASDDRPAQELERDAKDVSPQQVNQLLRERKYEQAAELLDAALKKNPFDQTYANLNVSASMGMAGKSRDVAIERLTKQFDKLMSVEVLDASQSSILASTASALTSLMREASVDEKLTVIDKATAKLEVTKEANPSGLQSLATAKARLLVTGDRAQEAREVLDTLLAATRAGINPAEPSTRRNYVALVYQYASLLSDDFPEAVAEVEQRAEQMALAALDSERTDGAPPALADVQSYVQLKTGTARRLSYSKPIQAMEIVEETEATLGGLKDELAESQAKALARFDGQLASLRSQLAASLKREALVGTSAPPLDAAHFVAMDKVTMDELKGKVVLLDFWAVWCGPCIATFPHLIEWHEQFADDGLVILGVTKFYDYRWNEEAGRAEKTDEVPEEEELKMLAKFREAYALHHGFVVTPEGSDYSQQFGVTGIPQAVLLDRQGRIRMIKVGSGKANAEALEAEIKSLLLAGEE